MLPHAVIIHSVIIVGSLQFDNEKILQTESNSYTCSNANKDNFCDYCRKHFKITFIQEVQKM